MSYTPTVWQTGDIVSSTKLNKLENAVKDLADELDEGVPYDDSETYESGTVGYELNNLKSAVDELDDIVGYGGKNVFSAYPTDNASGAVASFADGAAMPVKSLVVNVEPVQSGSGDPSPDNVRPISGWSEAKVARTGKNLLKLAQSEMTVSGWNARFPFSIKAGTYMISCQNQMHASDDTKLGLRLSFYDVNGSIIKDIWDNYAFGQGTFSGTIAFSEAEAEKITVIEFRPRSTGITYQNIADGQIMLELGSVATAYEPYNGQTVTIDLDGTRYGGTLDVLTGVLTVEWVEATIDPNNISKESNDWNTQGVKTYYISKPSGKGKYPGTSGVPNILCNIASAVSYNGLKTTASETAIAFTGQGNYLQWTSPSATLVEEQTRLTNTPMQVVYELDEPTTVQLDPETLSTLLGENNIWADTGDVSATYRADPSLYVGKKVSAAEQVMELIITANREDSMTATKAYVSGDLIIVGGKLYKATTSIANGATLTVNTNVSQTTVAAEIAAVS